MRKCKRLPYGRRGRYKRPNMSNCEDITGSRCFVTGTVGRVKRELDEAGIAYKKVRVSGFNGIVEVIYTQQGGRNSPCGHYLGLKKNRFASLPSGRRFRAY